MKPVIITVTPTDHVTELGRGPRVDAWSVKVNGREVTCRLEKHEAEGLARLFSEAIHYACEEHE